MGNQEVPRPIVYQINTLVWLNTLSRRYERAIHLGNVPTDVLDELAQYRCNFVWLMGIWHRGEKCRRSALNYVHEYRGALPDVTDEDVVGSAYAIGGYTVDKAIGGKRGLETFRRQMLARGMKLMLDFVPNHVGLDHPWISQHPDYFVQGTAELLAKDSGNFFAAQDSHGHPLVIAHGRDPHFSGWIDTAQLNAFSAAMRIAALETLIEIATMCDAVRCDMAMLLTDKVFQRTWGWLGVRPLAQPYWPQVIGAVRAEYPDFLFVAEVYWNMEFEMLQQGFDFTYDKTLYDHAVHHKYDGIHAHFRADISFLKRNIRFIENHDEPRAATALGAARSRVFATLILTVPGAVLLHDGQFIGRRVKLPVQITRQPDETPDPALLAFYHTLLAEAAQPIYRAGQWTLLGRRGGSSQVMAYAWLHGDEMRLVLLNLGATAAQALLDLSPLQAAIGGRALRLSETFSSQQQELDGDTLLTGWRVELAANEARIYHVARTMARPRVFKAEGHHA